MNGKQLKNSILQWAIQGKLVPPACRQAGKTLTTNPKPHIEGKDCWFTYVIECEDGSFYKGHTHDLLQRYKQHCTGTGAIHTKKHKPKQLYYWEMHYSEEAAIAREKWLKSGIGREWFKKEVVDNPEQWEPASVLLERIRAEKRRLTRLPDGQVKEGKLKKQKNESIIFRLPAGQAGGDDNSHYEKFLATGEVRCIDDEIPFELPKSWEWCRIENIFILNPKNNAVDDAMAAFIPMEKIDATYLSKFTYIERKWGDIKNGFTHFSDGDVAFAKITPCFQNRKSMILRNLPNGIGAGTTELKVLRPYCGSVIAEYLLFFLESPYFVEEASFKGTANQQRIISGYLERKLFPLPPLEEQKRIVRRIEELLPLVERYSEAQDKLDTLNANINEALKKSILQEAIQGKLVPQDPNDEPASVLLQRIKEEKERLIKEKKIKRDKQDTVILKSGDNGHYEKIGKTIRCIDDEIPFEIPDSWCWVRLDDLCTYIQRGKSPKYSLIKKYPVIAQKCNQWDGFHIEKAQFIEPTTLTSYGEERILQDDDLMWNSTGLGTLGRMAIYKERLNPYELAVADSHVTVIRPLKDKILTQYLFYYFTSDTVQSVIEDKADGSTKQKELANTTIKKYIVPVPPLAEQRRIVDKITELFGRLK